MEDWRTLTDAAEINRLTRHYFAPSKKRHHAPLGVELCRPTPYIRLTSRPRSHLMTAPPALLSLIDAGWSSPVARQAHNLKVAGSNPAPATNIPTTKAPALKRWGFRASPASPAHADRNRSRKLQLPKQPIATQTPNSTDTATAPMTQSNAADAGNTARFQAVRLPHRRAGRM